MHWLSFYINYVNFFCHCPFSKLSLPSSSTQDRLDLSNFDKRDNKNFNANVAEKRAVTLEMFPNRKHNYNYYNYKCVWLSEQNILSGIAQFKRKWLFKENERNVKTSYTDKCYYCSRHQIEYMNQFVFNLNNINYAFHIFSVLST